MVVKNVRLPEHLIAKMKVGEEEMERVERRLKEEGYDPITLPIGYFGTIVALDQLWKELQQHASRRKIVQRLLLKTTPKDSDYDFLIDGNAKGAGDTLRELGYDEGNLVLNQSVVYGHFFNARTLYLPSPVWRRDIDSYISLHVDAFLERVGMIDVYLDTNMCPIERGATVATTLVGPCALTKRRLMKSLLLLVASGDLTDVFCEESYPEAIRDAMGFISCMDEKRRKIEDRKIPGERAELASRSDVLHAIRKELNVLRNNIAPRVLKSLRRWHNGNDVNEDVRNFLRSLIEGREEILNHFSCFF